MAPIWLPEFSLFRLQISNPLKAGFATENWTVSQIDSGRKNSQLAPSFRWLSFACRRPDP